MREEYIKDKSKGEKRKKGFRIARNRSKKLDDKNVHKYLKNTSVSPYSVEKARKLLIEKGIKTEGLSKREILRIASRYTSNISDAKKLAAVKEEILNYEK